MLVLSAAVVLLATSASAQTVNTLKADRAAGRLSFLPYTLDQRNALLTQAETVVNQAWVNYESKLVNYGSAADPAPTLKRLRDNLATITDADLQLSLADVFVQIRDLHTRFSMAGPHRCFSVTTGVFLEFVESDNIETSPRVVVLRKDTRAPITNLLGADFAAITVGDELVAINGDSFLQWFRKNEFTSGAGANLYGGQRRAIDYLSLVSGANNRLPADDTITFTFKSRATGATYTSTINYVTNRNNACWTTTTNLYKKITNTTAPGASAADAPREFRRQLAALDTDSSAAVQAATAKGPVSAIPVSYAASSNAAAKAASDPVLRRKNPLKNPIAIVDSPSIEYKKAVIGDVALGPVRLTRTAQTGLSYGIWDAPGKNLGVLRLDDFSPPNYAEALDIIRSLLANQLKDTNAVLIDIRDNGGGTITYASSIPQFFKPDFEPFGARFLYNDVMKRLFVDTNGPGEAFYDAYMRTAPGSKYTEIGLFDTQEDLNTYGQAYLKPVGILNNGRCYSSCDLLSSNFQDSATGTIFGEDGATGAGGANVLQFADLVTTDPTDFKPFPFTTELGQYGNRLSVGIRQAVRVGLNKGQLIEDAGIKADVIVRARLEDILPGATTSSQYDRIADALAAEGKKNGKAGLGFRLEPFSLEVLAGNVKVSPEVAGLEEITVESTTGKRLGRRRDLFAGVGAAKHTLPLEFLPPASGLGNSKVVVTSHKAGKQLLKTNRYLRSVPKDADRINAVNGLNWDKTLSPATGIYNNGASLRDDRLGWNKVGDKWQIGNGKEYALNVDSAIEHFLTAPVGSKFNVKLTASISTEADFDYLYLNYVDATGKVTALIRSKDASGKTVDGVSGAKEIDESFPFTTTTDKFSIAARFVSDAGVNDRGVTLTSFSITA